MKQNFRTNIVTFDLSPISQQTIQNLSYDFQSVDYQTFDPESTCPIDERSSWCTISKHKRKDSLNGMHYIVHFQTDTRVECDKYNQLFFLNILAFASEHFIGFPIFFTKNMV